MHMSRLAASRLFIWAILGGGLANLTLDAQPTPKKDKDPVPAASAIRLPSGAIIVIAKDADAIDKPDAVYLSPEKFKELNDQIEALKKQLAAEKAAPPSSCELDGRVEKRGTQSVVRLKAVFKFRTLAPRSIVFLGCQKAQCVEAKLEDGKLPLLSAGEKGLSVVAETAGEHSLTLELEMPLQPRGPKGGEIGFELGLPGAPLTMLTFAPPAGVKRITIARREIGNLTPAAPGPDPGLDVKRFDVENLQPGAAGEALGPIAFLAVSWEAGKQPNNVAARSTEADVQVTIGETEIQAEARLRLRGAAKEWRFLAPYNAEVTVGRAPAPGTAQKPLELPVDQAPDLVRPEPGKADWRIRFKEPNSAELLVVIATHSARNRSTDPKARTLWPVGPFAALDVAKQEGIVRVRSLPHLRTTAILRGDTQRIDGSDDPNAEAVYRYRSLPAAAKDQLQAPLDLDIRAATGIVQTRVDHHLSFEQGGWRLRSEISVTPIRTEVETLDLEVPVPGTFEASTPKLVEGIIPLRDSGPQRRVIQIKLAAPQRSEFSLVLEGTYPSRLGVQETTLVLPRLLNVMDRAGRVTITVPDGFDLRGGVYQWDGDKPGSHFYPLEPVAGPNRSTSLATGVSRTVATVELAWKPLQSDFRVQATTDITLDDRRGRAVQKLRCTFADKQPRKLRLHGAAAVSGLTISPGSLENTGPGEWIANLPAEPLTDSILTLTWSFALPANGEESTKLAAPLLWLDGASSYESRVRFLRDRDAASRLLPALEPDSPWQELPIELLPAETTLLVVRTSGPNVPLTATLRDTESISPTMPSVWIDRALIQAQSADAAQKYRARFHLQKWMSRSLDLELPANASEVEVRLNGLHTDVRDAPTEGEAGRAIRVPLPVWRERQKLMIEVRYSLPGAQGESHGGWVSRWQPPRLRGRVAVGAVYWQIALPARLQPLSLGEPVFEERWTFRNGLAQVLPAFAAGEMEKWIAYGQEPDGSETTPAWVMADVGVTARQSALAPVRFIVAPRVALLCAVSLAALLAGLLLWRLPKRTVGVLAVFLGAAAVVVGFLWPQPAGHILAAALPGLALLAIVVGAQRFLDWRYRRRLARMPGFSRVRTESVLLRTNGKRSSRETSTVDAAPEGIAGNPS